MGKGNDWAHKLSSLQGPLKRHSDPSCALKWFPSFISYTHMLGQHEDDWGVVDVADQSTQVLIKDIPIATG